MQIQKWTLSIFALLFFYLISCKKDTEQQNPVVINQKQRLSGVWRVDSTIEETGMFFIHYQSSFHLLDFKQENKMIETEFSKVTTYDFNYLPNFSIVSDINEDGDLDTSKVLFYSDTRADLVTEIAVNDTGSGGNYWKKTYVITKKE